MSKKYPNQTEPANSVGGIRVLNLYAGLGGNRKNWKDCQVTAIEYDPKIAAVYQELNPDDEVIICDAHEYLLNNFQNFDRIWSSPPCQSHSKMIRSGRNRKPRYPDMRLYEQILLLQNDFKGDWVIENVKPYYKPLIEPMYVGRHAFWSNLDIQPMENEPKFKNFINRQNLSDKKDLMDWLGIHYEKNIYYEGNHCPTQILRNCVHPLVGEHVFNSKVKA
jgi:DNA (cytosine-5)-methyltransferase 1